MTEVTSVFDDRAGTMATESCTDYGTRQGYDISVKNHAGTAHIKQFTRINAFFSSGNNCYLFIKGTDGYQELWKSDGTTSGTVRLKRVQVNLSYFDTPVTINNIFYFVGNDGEHGNELWRSDGSAQGTYMVKDLRADDVNAADFYTLTEFKGEVYFSAVVSGKQWALFRSDGTAAGTARRCDRCIARNDIPLCI